MSAAVQALPAGNRKARNHGKTGYHRGCACCFPQDATSPGKPQRRMPLRPQLAWRARRDTALALAEGNDHVL